VAIRAFLVFIALGLLGCDSPDYPKGGPHYYESWASYVAPYRPVGRLTKDDVSRIENEGGNYYIAYFDGQRRIVSFEQILAGKSLWKVEYEYLVDKRVLEKTYVEGIYEKEILLPST